jgi:hypothetical protein
MRGSETEVQAKVQAAYKLAEAVERSSCCQLFRVTMAGGRVRVSNVCVDDARIASSCAHRDSRSFCTTVTTSIMHTSMFPSMAKYVIEVS